MPRSAILDHAPDHARVMVFALHGMGRNNGWTEVFPQLIQQIQRGGAAAAPKRGLLYRIKSALPWELVREVTTRLPASVNQRLVSVWSRRMYDWRQTRFFPLPVDVNGFVRLNLAGREAEGIVPPAERAAVLEEVRDALLSFRTLEGDQPIAEAVDRVDDLVAAGAPRRQYLPDLCVRWNDQIAIQDGIGVRSPRYGELRRERGLRLASGRAGNHLGAGWLLAAGPGIAAGTRLATQTPIDLPVAIFRWLGQPRPARFEGNPDAALAPPPAAPPGVPDRSPLLQSEAANPISPAAGPG